MRLDLHRGVANGPRGRRRPADGRGGRRGPGARIARSKPLVKTLAGVRGGGGISLTVERTGSSTLDRATAGDDVSSASSRRRPSSSSLWLFCARLKPTRNRGAGSLASFLVKSQLVSTQRALQPAAHERAGAGDTKERRSHATLGQDKATRHQRDAARAIPGAVTATSPCLTAARP